MIGKRPSAQIYTMLGILEDCRGNTAEAERDYRKALEIAPDTPIAANNLAWLIVDNQGNLDEALQLCDSQLVEKPIGRRVLRHARLSLPEKRIVCHRRPSS